MHFVAHSLQKRRRRAPLGLAGIVAAAVIGYSMIHPASPAPITPTVHANTQDARAIGQAQTAFGIDLLGQLTHATPGQNVVFSPTSIATILTLTMDGTGGQTRADMAHALHLSLLPAKAVNDGSRTLMQSFAGSPDVTLSVANALWANKGVSFAPTFQATAQDSFGADAQTLDFSSSSAADTINDWVGKNTRGHITQIVTPDVVAAANVVLTNAVYFEGKWQSAFDKDDTQDAPFTLTDGTNQVVPMMMQEAQQFGYQENAEFQAVRLPYGKGRFVMDVFLPRGKMEDFLPAVTEDLWQKWDSAFKPTQVQIFLPRWKMQGRAELSSPLKSLGMARAFGNGADFVPMGLPHDYISAVLHKATVDVDEQGTVATAATAVIMEKSMHIAPPPKVFRADHPFLFAIQDTESGALLFIGVVYSPKA